jgi:hypothetical protein
MVRWRYHRVDDCCRFPADAVTARLIRGWDRDKYQPALYSLDWCSVQACTFVFRSKCS